MVEGARIYVKSLNFEGMATIMYLAPGEIYPVQVEMDEGDSDGHKVQRVSYSEVSKEKPADPAQHAVIFSGPDDPQKYIGQLIQQHKQYGFESGQKFILGVVSYPGVYKPGAAKSFYLYDPEDMEFRGCMPAEMFSIVGPFVPVEVIPEISEPVLPDIPLEIHVTETRQMSFFDLL